MAPQVRKAAKRRVAAADAERAIRRIVDDPTAPPVTDPVEALGRLAGRLELAATAVGRRVNELRKVGTRSVTGVETVRAEVDLWTRLLALLQASLATLSRHVPQERSAAVEADAAARLAEEHQWIMDRVIASGLVEPDRQPDLRAVLVEALTALVEGQPFASVHRVIEA